VTGGFPVTGAFSISAKTFFIAEIFRAHSTNSLRYKKSLRDDGGEAGRAVFPGVT
jgi:hypothetical protein